MRESGQLYGINADVGLRGKQAEIRLGAAYYGGDVDYDGQTQTNVPINSSTRERIVDVSLTLVYHLPFVAVPTLSLYGGPGFRHWRRDIQSVGTVAGLDETCRWWKFQAGMDMSWGRGENRWILDGRVIRALNPGVEVDLGSGFETTELSLGDRWGWRVGGAGYMRCRLDWRLRSICSTNVKAWARVTAKYCDAMEHPSDQFSSPESR